MMDSVTSRDGSCQETRREVVERAVACTPLGELGSSLDRPTASRALAWLVPALFSAMHW